MLNDIEKVDDITKKDYVRYLNLLNSEKMGLFPLRFFFTALWMVPAAFLIGAIASAISSATTALIVTLVGVGVTLPISSIVTLKTMKTYKEIKRETKEHLKEIKELKEYGQWEKLQNLMDLYIRTESKTKVDKKLEENKKIKNETKTNIQKGYITIKKAKSLREETKTDDSEINTL